VAGFNWLKTGPNVRYCEGGNGYSDCIQTKIVMAQEDFHIYETVRLFGEGVILWPGFNWLKTEPNVQIL